MILLLFSGIVIACEKEGNEEALPFSEESIVDPELRNDLLRYFDMNRDSKLSKYEIDNVTKITVYRNPKIYSIEGIEIFTNLKVIEIYSSEIQIIDLSKNLKIKSVTFRNNAYLHTVYLPKRSEEYCDITNEDYADIIFK